MACCLFGARTSYAGCCVSQAPKHNGPKPSINFILTRMGLVNEPYTSVNWTTTGSVHGYSPVCQITVMMFTYHFEVAKLLWWMPGYVYVPPFEGGEIHPSRNGEEWMIIIDLRPRLSIKTVFPRCGDSHVKDKTDGPETVLPLTWRSLI